MNEFACKSGYLSRHTRQQRHVHSAARQLLSPTPDSRCSYFVAMTAFGYKPSVETCKSASTRIWMRGIAVLLIVSMAACGTTPATPQSGDESSQHVAEKRAPYRLPPGAKIALAAGQFGSTITLNQTKTEIKTTGDFNYGRGVKECATDVKMMVSTLGLGVIFCPIVGAITEAGDATLAAAGIGARHRQTTTNYIDVEKVVSVDKHIVDTKDVSPELEAATEKLKVVMESLTLQRWFVDQRPFLQSVQRYAVEQGITKFAMPPPQATKPKLNLAQNDGATNYVFEIAVTALELKRAYTSDEGQYYAFDFYAQGRLVRTNDGTVVDTYATRTDSPARTIDEWVADDGKEISAALQSALPDLAQTFVVKWIAPAI